MAEKKKFGGTGKSRAIFFGCGTGKSVMIGWKCLSCIASTAVTATRDVQQRRIFLMRSIPARDLTTIGFDDFSILTKISPLRPGQT